MIWTRGDRPWPGRSNTGSVILSLPDFDGSALPERLELPDVVLHRKSEFHLTLLSTREAEQVCERMEENALRDAFEACRWNIGLRDHFDLMREIKADEPARWSVIQHVEAPGLNEFRARLAGRSGVALPEAPPHVTLFVAGHGKGIGLSSRSDYVALRIRGIQWRG